MTVSQRIDNFISQYDLPILTLETRRILRGKQQFRGAFIITALCSMLSVPLLFLKIAATRSTIIPYNDWLGLVAALIQGVLLMALFYVFQGIIVPQSARSIASERELGSFYGLALTPLSSFSIVAQKTCIYAIESVLIVAIVLPATLILHFVVPDWSWATMPCLYLAASPIIGVVGASAGVLGSELCANVNTAHSVAGVLVVVSICLPIWLAYTLITPQANGLYGGIFVTWAPIGRLLIGILFMSAFVALFTWLSVLRLEHLRRSQ